VARVDYGGRPWLVLPILQTCKLFAGVLLPLVYQKVRPRSQKTLTNILRHASLDSLRLVEELDLCCSRTSGFPEWLAPLQSRISDLHIEARMKPGSPCSYALLSPGNSESNLGLGESRTSHVVALDQCSRNRRQLRPRLKKLVVSNTYSQCRDMLRVLDL
jgi:hypothetical protein